MQFLFRMKCQKYEVYMGNLIYVSKEIDGVDPRKRYVIRVGEVLPILRAVHNKIGHLGMKRTLVYFFIKLIFKIFFSQAAVLQCFYWRSVRADVQRFVANCSFCNQKKEAGKKVLRAPINVFGNLKFIQSVSLGLFLFITFKRCIQFKNFLLFKRVNCQKRWVNCLIYF